MLLKYINQRPAKSFLIIMIIRFLNQNFLTVWYFHFYLFLKAEGVQSYFNVNDYANPSNGIHGPINTKDKLQSYDSGLFNLIEEVWPCHNVYIKRCQSSRGINETIIKRNAEYK